MLFTSAIAARSWRVLPTLPAGVVYPAGNEQSKDRDLLDLFPDPGAT